MGDEDDGTLLEHGPAIVNEGELAVGVEHRGRFVEDQDGRILEEGAGEGDPLTLPAGQADALVADECVVALRQMLNESMRLGGSRGGFDLFRGGVGAAVGDVLAHGAVQQQDVLGNQTDLAAQTGDADAANVSTNRRSASPCRQQP